MKATAKKSRIRSRIRNSEYRSKDPDPYQNVTDLDQTGRGYTKFCLQTDANSAAAGGAYRALHLYLGGHSQVRLWTK